MSRAEEIQNQIEELEKKTQELQKELEIEKQKEVKCPFKYGDEYFLLPSDGMVSESIWGDYKFDNRALSQGNIFKTKEEAELEHDKRDLLTRFRQFRDKCNEEWKQKREDCIDFNGYHIEIYNGTDDGMLLRSDWDPVCERFCLFGYFKKQVDCDSAIELFGDEIKRLYLEW